MEIAFTIGWWVLSYALLFSTSTVDLGQTELVKRVLLWLPPVAMVVWMLRHPWSGWVRCSCVALTVLLAVFWLVVVVYAVANARTSSFLASASRAIL